MQSVQSHGLAFAAALEGVVTFVSVESISFVCSVAGTAQLLLVGGEGDWTAPQGSEIAALLDRNLGALRVPTTCEIKQILNSASCFVRDLLAEPAPACKTFVSCLLLRLANIWQGMISIRTLSKLAQLRHEGALLVRAVP